jgi:hypothetical protein
VAEVATAADGSVRVAGLSAGEYIVRPTATSGLTACPAERNVEVGGADDALVAAFQFKTSCTVRVLVVSGGDVDDTGAAAGQLSGLGDVSAEAFFYINRTPGLDALRAYDAVLVFQNGLFNEAVELGAEISEFVSLGGNVVFASFYWQGRSDSGFGSPGWGSLEGLDPFRSIGGAVYPGRVAGRGHRSPADSRCVDADVVELLGWRGREGRNHRGGELGRRDPAGGLREGLGGPAHGGREPVPRWGRR